MKRFALYLATAATVVASCSSREENIDSLLKTDEIFYASFEQPKEDGTKVYANEDLLLRWTADDRVSIFNKITYNQEYKFTGQTGANSGGFKKVESDEFVTGNATSHVVSVYPYQESTEISESEELTVTLPAEQHYAEDTFGLGANTMVSVSSDNILQYKNVGGYLMLKLYGEGVLVSSITLKGNNGEKLAGLATITMPLNGFPSVTMASDATEEITLTCDTPVQLGATSEDAIQFWFVVPPVTFSSGFTITVNETTGGVFEKKTSKNLAIERNKLSRMSAIEVEKKLPAGNIVFADEKVKEKLVAAFDTDGDGELSYEEAAAVTSGDDLKSAFGAIKTYKSFDEFQFFTEVKTVPARMFADWNLLESITLPKGIESIKNQAFSGCISLTSICIPESVSELPYELFKGCEKLNTITIPNTIKYIGSGVFQGCCSLESFMIPDNVSKIESNTFNGCKNLRLIGIPDSVGYIGSYAFYDCSSLLSITIPDGVREFNQYVFWGCSQLKEINIPSKLFWIADYAFYGCEQITSIIFPDSLEHIGAYAFYGCSMLESINIPESVSSLGRYCFSDCQNLLSATIPESITRLEEYTFANCSSLESIIIPNSVKQIGLRCFAECKSLSSIELSNVIGLRVA